VTVHEETASLRAVPMFAGVDTQRLRLLSFTSERVSFMPGECFIKQGEPGDCAYVILEGEGEVLIDGAAGPTVVGLVGRNGMVGEVSLLLHAPRTATIRAKTRMCCLQLSREVFESMVREFPDFAVAVMRDLAARLEQTTRKVQEALQTNQITAPDRP
jgi:CRP/FNR family cyclic AMP-dependent transcriptional regulator